VFATISKGIAEGSIRGQAETIRALGPVYPADEVFLAAFVEKVFPKGKERLVRYIIILVVAVSIIGGIERDASPRHHAITSWESIGKDLYSCHA